MVSYFLISLVIMGAVIIGMAIGVILSNREIKGSCGGLNRVLGEDCDFCDKKTECVEKSKLEAQRRGSDELEQDFDGQQNEQTKSDKPSLKLIQ